MVVALAPVALALAIALTIGRPHLEMRAPHGRDVEVVLAHRNSGQTVPIVLMVTDRTVRGTLPKVAMHHEPPLAHATDILLHEHPLALATEIPVHELPMAHATDILLHEHPMALATRTVAMELLNHHIVPAATLETISVEILILALAANPHMTGSEGF